MAKLGKRGNNLNRAQSIISAIGKEPEGKPALPPVDGIPIVETPIVETPIVETPIVETPIVETPIVETPIVETPIVETPIVETPIVETPIVEVPQPPVLAEISDEVILSKLSETLGRKIESYEDLKPKEIAVDPELKQLMEWKERTNLSLTQWADYNKDFSKMGDLDVAREILSQKYPTFTKEMLDFELQGLVYDEDIDTDSDKMRKTIELTKLATEGRAKLEANKLTLKTVEGTSALTTEQQEAITYATTMKQAESLSVTNQTAYEQSLNLAALNLDTISLNLDEGVVIEHKVDDADKNGLKDYVLTVPHWYNEDGSPNHSEIAKDGYKIKNFDSLLKQAFEQGKAVGVEGSIKSKGNITLDAQGKPQGQEGEKKGNINSVIENLTGGKSGKFRFRRPKTN